jgi:hypothetical protein
MAADRAVFQDYACEEGYYLYDESLILEKCKFELNIWVHCSNG